MNWLTKWLRGVFLKETPKPEVAVALASPEVLTPYEWALREVGQKEVPGHVHNPRILWYHAFTETGALVDEVSWCSAFMCAAAENNGYVSTRNAAARSWVKYGEPGDGSVGDIAVFWRVDPHGWQGHVAFVAKPYKEGDPYISCLGGNQSNQVCVRDYLAHTLLAFRRFPIH